jgi:hypothetical protein
VKKNGRDGSKTAVSGSENAEFRGGWKLGGRMNQGLIPYSQLKSTNLPFFGKGHL